MVRFKKGQEEMVGFVLIIVLVAVIFLVFLGIFVRQDRTDTSTSIEVSQFLESYVEYTSECSLDAGFSYKKIDELALAYERGIPCSSGKSSREVFEETSVELIESSWTFSSESPEKGYRFTAVFPSAEEIVLEKDWMDCTETRGADKFFSDITITLEICRN